MYRHTKTGFLINEEQFKKLTSKQQSECIVPTDEECDEADTEEFLLDDMDLDIMLAITRGTYMKNQ